MVKSALGILELSEALVLAGRRVDLSGLDNTIGRLCAQILDLPTRDAVGFGPQLEMLRDAADRLTRTVDVTAQAPHGSGRRLTIS